MCQGISQPESVRLSMDTPSNMCHSAHMPERFPAVNEEQAGRQAFAALLRERIPDYPVRGSLEAFAARCGGKLTGPQIGQYARGELEPRRETLTLLCKGMGVPLLYGFSVLAGLESAEKVPPPDELHELSTLVNRIADLMNRLMIRATNAEHANRRHPRPRTNRKLRQNNDRITESIDSPSDTKMDYDHQEANNTRIYVNHLLGLAASLT